MAICFPCPLLITCLLLEKMLLGWMLPAAQCSYGQHPRWLFGFFEEGFNLGDTSGNDRDKALVDTVVLAVLGDQTVVSQ